MKRPGRATITINRPKVLYAFTGHTVDELTQAFMHAWTDRSVRAVSDRYRRQGILHGWRSVDTIGRRV
jgi:1,4-dihydroxy-2-naphthoyl-CoA synthase